MLLVLPFAPFKSESQPKIHYFFCATLKHEVLSGIWFLSVSSVTDRVPVGVGVRASTTVLYLGIPHLDGPKFWLL